MNNCRLEAFSDGVIAIIITIMVLELKVPRSIFSWPSYGSCLTGESRNNWQRMGRARPRRPLDDSLGGQFADLRRR